MSVVVTGGAGFIGSCIIRLLNDLGLNDIIIVDNIGTTEKWRNILNKKYSEYIHKSEFLERIEQGKIKDITHIIHMGACSATTEKNFDYLYTNNLEYTKSLWNYSIKNNCSFIYASSAATYGSGVNGFDDRADIQVLRPLNAYGYSKHLFDLWVEKQEKFPKQHVGLKFFNVYGPNEYFKGSMASVILHGYKQVKELGNIKLFKSYNTNYKHGEQLRDFIYVKDICTIIKFFIENPQISGLFNCGTGNVQSFNDLANAVFHALQLPPNIEYIEMPENLKQKYQYFTRAETFKLRDVGYNEPFHGLKSGVTDYVQNFLEKQYEVY
jgi:ADP-L-glycero-D-manno-heptose 6-epimerase